MSAPTIQKKVDKMARVPNKHVYKDENLTLTECWDGFWLYYSECGMNLAMRVKDPYEAFASAVHYYQKRLKEVSKREVELQGKVGDFLTALGIEQE